MVGLGPVSINAEDIVHIHRSFPLGPKLFFKDGRWVITTPEAVARLERLGFLSEFKAPGRVPEADGASFL
jgi:hypothetical protein